MSQEPEVWKFVERWTWKTGGGELFELLKEGAKQFPSPHGQRATMCTVGDSWHAVALEFEWHGWAEHARVWGEWQANPEWQAFIKRMMEVVPEGDISREFWDLE